MRFLPNFSQRNMKPKLAKLNLYQMWDICRLNQDKNLARIVPQTLKILYPEGGYADLSMNERISLYFNGLNSSGFFYFQAFISRLKHG